MKIADHEVAVKIAKVEILAALAALHRRFCDGLRDRLGNLPAQKERQARRLELKDKSLRLSGCDDLDHTAATARRYGAWLEVVRAADAGGSGEEFAAADSCIKQARELASIARLVDAFPESAQRRARKISGASL